MFGNWRNITKFSRRYPMEEAANDEIPPRYHIATLISPADSGAI